MVRGITPAWAVWLLAACGAAAAQEQYEIGGPLAGLKLPLFQGQFGEKPGYPGCIPELIAQGKEVTDMGNSYREWDSQGQAPEVELYPGSVEHWRAYMFKYMPIRSFFDRQSQVKNFTAPAIPGAAPAQVERYAAPVYWVPRHNPVQDTGKRLAPVPVVRMKVNAPVFQLDLGELGEGMYAVRVIAAVETRELRPFRKPVFLRMKVNDGLQGETSDYKRRIGYCDEFYSVCEFYFNAPARRAYAAQLWMDAGSEVDLLVHNISVDDVLAGATRRAIKTKVNLDSATRAARNRDSRLERDERLARDAAIWNYLPPLNAQGSGNSWKQAAYYAIFPDGVTFGAQGKDRTELQQEFGPWAAPGVVVNNRFTPKRELWNVFLSNPKMNLTYTLDDLKAHRPLPDPYPFKDDGTGLYTVDPKDPSKGQVFAEIAIEVMNRIRGSQGLIGTAAAAWSNQGDADAARDGAIALARYAYLFPSIESATYLCNLTRDPGAYGRNMYNRRRETEAMFLEHYQNYTVIPTHYDRLFDYIQGNQELADSIGRFVPWVKTPEDVIRLIDVYLVQTTAKRILRYHYHTDPVGIAQLVAVEGTGEVTRPWLDWLFARTYIYPLPVAGIQDLIITGNDREGAQYIGSTFYAQGEGASSIAGQLQRFAEMGVLPPEYNVTDAVRYPKPLAKCHWQIDITIAGKDFPRIADVGGPDKSPGATIGNMQTAAVYGWKWSQDPRFAWIIKQNSYRKEFNDDEWLKIEAAAKQVPRAPWLDLKSRQVYNWCGVLEAGTELVDPNLRRAAYLRTGAGIGHQHADSLDLQYFMLGLPMTVDGGQRPGYCSPSDAASRVHNLVEVDGRSIRTQSWVSALSDGPGARYLRATAAPPDGVRFFERSIALVDANEPATSYVFDVFRVAGGKAHSYCFHGPVADNVVTNATGMAPVAIPPADAEPTADQRYLAPFKDVAPREGAKIKETVRNDRQAGVAPAILETTWRYSRQPGPGSEMQMVGRLDPNAPRRYTRLHLLDAAGARVYLADAICYQWDYKYRCQMVRKDGGEREIESAFVALHEPYTGEPFIAERRALDIPGNDADARKAVAVEVKTRAGQTDFLFSDGRPEKTRTIGKIAVAGEFACLTTDQSGLRQAALTGGTLLRAPEVEITLARREYTGRITGVDYFKKLVTLDSAWPAACGGGILEIGGPNRMTSYTSDSVKPDGAGSLVVLTRGADYFRAQVQSVDAPKGIVHAQLEPTLGTLPGLDKDFVASNEKQTKFWRADVLADGDFALKGAPVAPADFAPEGALRLWEYGVGDSVRQSAFLHLRRVEPNIYEVTGNVVATIALPGKGIETSTDKTQWQPLKPDISGGKVRCRLTAVDFAKGRVYLRVQ